MLVEELELEGLLLIKPNVFKDERGYFFESYNKQKLRELGLDAEFVQDNESKSAKGVVRGLHFQAPPFAQGKLVRVIKGAVKDVVVDIRKNSPTYGQSCAVVLSEENKYMFYVPPGFAHGFTTLEDDTIFSYKCTQLYNKASEGCILWSDPSLGIDWGTDKPIVSDKDKVGELFDAFETPFIND